VQVGGRLGGVRGEVLDLLGVGLGGGVLSHDGSFRWLRRALSPCDRRDTVLPFDGLMAVALRSKR
jgi:hypothetical protein